jgi:hypothetical protein
LKENKELLIQSNIYSEDDMFRIASHSIFKSILQQGKVRLKEILTT